MVELGRLQQQQQQLWWRGQDGRALQWQQGHAVWCLSSAAERLNHLGEAGALPLSTATESDE